MKSICEKFGESKEQKELLDFLNQCMPSKVNLQAVVAFVKAGVKVDDLQGYIDIYTKYGLTE